ncbi:facilitated trehalose transporter Tret1-like [Anticarsia gemmatalis]|uniref:facilitated trehalose transporter Tret1-like n=1 Tax=Anticarsia gemmatalis TaxID=129554 RepID=UPI003F7774F2
MTPLFKQIWTMSAVLISQFCMGLVLGYPSSLLPALHHPDSPIKANLHMSSWLGSIVGVACIPSFLISSVFMSIYGRRITEGFLILPGIAGWLTIYFANDIQTLIVGRFLCGLTGAASSLGAIVIGEYTSPKYRGVFLYLKNASVCLGAMFIHIISRYIHWRNIALVSLIPLFVALVIVFTWPESPAWLASQHQYEKSEESFYWLRGHSEASQRELEETISAQKARLSASKKKSNCQNLTGFFRKFTQKDFLKPMLIILLAAIILEMSGRHVFPAYALLIMAEISGESYQSFYYALGIDLIITTSAIFASALGKVVKRRTLLFATGFAAVVVLTLVCLYLFLAAKNIIPDDKPWIPFSLLIIYFVLANLGCAPVPLALVGEVFPLAHRGIGAALSGVWISICLVGGLQSTPYLINSINVYGCFAVYGCILGITLFILYFILPETKDKTLQEIENYFNYGKFKISIDEEANKKMIRL